MLRELKQLEGYYATDPTGEDAFAIFELESPQAGEGIFIGVSVGAGSGISTSVFIADSLEGIQSKIPDYLLSETAWDGPL